MSRQPRLFACTKRGDLLMGDELATVNNVRQKIKDLQAQRKVAEDWRLDIFCREPALVKDVIIGRVNISSAAAAMGRYSIAIVIDPGVLKPYTLSVAYFDSRKETEEVLDTIRAYLTHRYGV